MENRTEYALFIWTGDEKMNFEKLIGTEILASKIALGTATFGTGIDKELSFRLLDTFLDCGGNLIDTASCYANWFNMGESISEKTIGEWIRLRDNRSRIVISTKGAHPRHEEIDIPRVNKKDINEDIEKSLVNLRTDYIDVYFLHRDDENKSVGEIMEVLNELVKTGKTRSIGLSNWRPERVAEAIEYCNANSLVPVTSSQIQFGIADPNPGEIDPTTEFMTKEAYEYYKKAKLNLFSFSSQSGGYFFMSDENGNPKPNPAYDSEKNRERFHKVRSLAENYGASVGAVIVSSLLNNPYFNTIPIIGGATEEQVKDSMSGLDLKMKEADVLDLTQK